ncbi:gamma carbonic anhydrase family protein, partial [Schwartzia sp. (in: firmicutes)]
MYTLKNNAFQGITPQIHDEAFVAPQVFLSGDVRVGKHSSLWPGVVARGDVNYISVGECSNVQDLTCLHVADDNPCIIGDYVTIGHCAC